MGVVYTEFIALVFYWPNGRHRGQVLSNGGTRCLGGRGLVLDSGGGQSSGVRQIEVGRAGHSTTSPLLQVQRRPGRTGLAREDGGSGNKSPPKRKNPTFFRKAGFVFTA